MAQGQNEEPSADSKQTGGAQERHDGKPTNDASGAEKDPIEMLRADHRKVERLFGDYEKATASEKKSQLADEICTELNVHTLLEEEVFYPACRDHMDDRVLDEAQVEHDDTKALIVEIETGNPSDPYFDAKVKVLTEKIRHHIQEEEKPASGVLAKAKQAGLATPDMAQRLTALKRELMEEASAGTLGPLKTRSFRADKPYRADPFREPGARRSALLREREERGRVSGDAWDHRRRGYDEDRRLSRRGWDEENDRGGMPPRDEEGRFVGGGRYRDDDDDRRYAHSRRDGDDDYRRSSRQESGGWDERGGPRLRDDDDRRYGRRRAAYEDDWPSRKYVKSEFNRHSTRRGHGRSPQNRQSRRDQEMGGRTWRSLAVLP